MRVTPIAGFHDADTDTDILARMSARKTASVSVSVSVSVPLNVSLFACRRARILKPTHQEVSPDAASACFGTNARGPNTLVNLLIHISVTRNKKTQQVLR